MTPIDHLHAARTADQRGCFSVAWTHVIAALELMEQAPAGLDAHPLAGVVWEVLGLDVGNVDDPEDAFERIMTILGLEERTGSRVALVDIAAVALAGIEACDAAERARGEGPSL